MDPVSLALATVGTLDLCLKYGKKLLLMCREYQNLARNTREMAMIIESLWIKTEVQLCSLKALWDTLPTALQAHYSSALQYLENKMVVAMESIQKIETLTAMDATSRQKIKALLVGRLLKQTVHDLEDWQRRFDPSWYLITRIASPTVDKRLADRVCDNCPPARRLAQMRRAIEDVASARNTSKDSVFKSPSLVSNHPYRISGTKMSVSSFVQTSEKVLLDQTSYTPRTTHIMAKTSVRDIARLLSNVEPMVFGLLKCKGVIEMNIDSNCHFQFILEIPKGLSSPRTLRMLLMEAPRCPLNHRIRLAQQLARSVTFIHTTGFVHKNIRPETILVFQEDLRQLGPSFLVGFERVRHSGAPTEYSGDIDWEKNLYRHPARQGLWPEDAFIMQHDIYSLGVCLLEIGLWHSFVESDGDSVTPSQEIALVSQTRSDKDKRRGAFAVKRRLVDLAQERLPSLVGERYTRLTLTCLNCLDESNGNAFGPEEELRYRDGIIVGVRYIEKVLLEVESICV